MCETETTEGDTKSEHIRFFLLALMPVGLVDAIVGLPHMQGDNSPEVACPTQTI